MKRYIKASYSTFETFKDFSNTYNENSKDQSKECLNVCKKVLRQRLDVPALEIEDSIKQFGDNYQTLCKILFDKTGYQDFLDLLSEDVEFESMGY